MELVHLITIKIPGPDFTCTSTGFYYCVSCLKFLLLLYRAGSHSTDPVEDLYTLGEEAGNQDVPMVSKAQKSLDTCFNNSIDPYPCIPSNLGHSMMHLVS